MPVFVPRWCASLDCQNCRVVDQCHSQILRILEENCQQHEGTKIEVETTTIAIYHEYCGKLAEFLDHFSSEQGTMTLRKTFVPSQIGIGEPSPQRIILDMINQDDENAPTDEVHVLRMKLNAALLQAGAEKHPVQMLAIREKPQRIVLTEGMIHEANQLMKNWISDLRAGLLVFQPTTDPRKCRLCPIRLRCKSAVLGEQMTIASRETTDHGTIRNVKELFLKRVESHYPLGFAEYAIAKYLKEMLSVRLGEGASTVELAAFEKATIDPYGVRILRQRMRGISPDYLCFVLERVEHVSRMETYSILDSLCKSSKLLMDGGVLKYCDQSWLPNAELWGFRDGRWDLLERGGNSKSLLREHKDIEKRAVFFDQIEHTIDKYKLAASMDVLLVEKEEAGLLLVKETAPPARLIHRIPLMVYAPLILPRKRKETVALIRRLINHAREVYSTRPLESADLYKLAGYYALYGLTRIRKGRRLLSKAGEIYLDLGKYLAASDSYATAWRIKESLEAFELTDISSLSDYDILLVSSTFKNVIRLRLLNGEVEAAENLAVTLEKHLNHVFPELTQNPVATSDDPYVISDLAILYRDLGSATKKREYFTRACSLLRQAEDLVESLGDGYLLAKIKVWLLQADAELAPLSKREYYDKASRIILEEILPNEDLQTLRAMEEALYLTLQGWKAMELTVSESQSERFEWLRRSNVAFRDSVEVIRSIGCPRVLYPETMILAILSDIVVRISDPSLEMSKLSQIRNTIENLARLELRSLELDSGQLSNRLAELVDHIARLLSTKNLRLVARKRSIESINRFLVQLTASFEPMLLGQAIQAFIPGMIDGQRSRLEDELIQLYHKADGDRRRLRGGSFEEFLACCFRGHGFPYVVSSIPIGGKEIDVYAKDEGRVIAVEAKLVFGLRNIEDIKSKKFPFVPAVLKEAISTGDIEYWIVSPEQFPLDLEEYLSEISASRSWETRIESSRWLLNFIQSIQAEKAGITESKVSAKIREFNIREGLTANVLRVLVRGREFASFEHDGQSI